MKRLAFAPKGFHQGGFLRSSFGRIDLDCVGHARLRYLRSGTRPETWPGDIDTTARKPGEVQSIIDKKERFLDWTSPPVRAVLGPMDTVDDARASMVDVIAELEQAIEAAMPGQAPGSDAGEIRKAIAEVRAKLDAAEKRLVTTERLRASGDKGNDG